MRLHNIPLSATPLLLSLLTFPLFAQNQPALAHDPDAQDTTTTDAQSPPPPMTPEQVALIERYLTFVHAQPVGKIDTRTAAAGQRITLRTAQDATLANGTELPRGTKLTGSILRAQAYKNDGTAAQLTIKIDRAVLEDGSSIPIRCVLRTIASTGPNAGISGVLDASQPGSRPRRNGGASSMGGGPIGADTSASMGGAGDSSVNNPSSTSSRNGGPAVGTTNAGSVPAGDPGLGGSGTRPVLENATAVAVADPELPVTVAGESIHDAPHPSGLPGVMLSGASVTGASGTLSEAERNIALDAGTQLTLGVISAK